MENLFTTDCIRTYSGLYVNVFEPTIDMISIEDIAHALSHQCRFGGHLPKFYSVAQHSCHCESLIEDEYKLDALMHDASEAYLLDMPRPIKLRMNDYKEIENGVMRLIAEKFQFEFPLNSRVKEVDDQVLKIEWDELMISDGGENTFKAHSPEHAKWLFLETFNRLTKSK
ncbi:MAG: hypothetical protein ABJH04_08075 [Cyclobacteriaceae bacterium]